MASFRAFMAYEAAVRGSFGASMSILSRFSDILPSLMPPAPSSPMLLPSPPPPRARDHTIPPHFSAGIRGSDSKDVVRGISLGTLIRTTGFSHGGRSPHAGPSQVAGSSNIQSAGWSNNVDRTLVPPLLFDGDALLNKHVFPLCARWISAVFGHELARSDFYRLYVLVGLALTSGAFSLDDMNGVLLSNIPDKARGADPRTEHSPRNEALDNSGGGSDKEKPDGHEDKSTEAVGEQETGLDDSVDDSSPIEAQEEDPKGQTAVAQKKPIFCEDKGVEAGGGSNKGEDPQEEQTVAEGKDPKEKTVDVAAQKMPIFCEDKGVEAGGGSNKDDAEDKRKKLLQLLELEKKMKTVQKIEFGLTGMAFRNYNQKLMLDRQKILQEIGAAILSEKAGEFAQEMQAIAQEREELDLKIDAMKVETSAVEKRESEILKDKAEVDTGRREVSLGKQQVASGLEHVSAERRALESDQYNLFLEKKVLEDMVKTNERKQRAAAIRFLKWFQGRPSWMSRATGTMSEWLSFVAVLLVFGGMMLSDRTYQDWVYLLGNMMLNEFKDALAGLKTKVERAERKPGNEDKETGDSDSGV